MESWLGETIQGLSPAEYSLYTLLLFFGICFLAYRIYQTFQRFRFISDTPTSRIASAPQGYIELNGLGEQLPGAVITSPFSGRSCIWYHCIVEKRKQVNRHNTWVEESNEKSDQIFKLEDESGHCLVDPEDARVIPTENEVWYGSNLQSKNLPFKNRGWFFNRIGGMGKYRFTEKLIPIAEPVYVIGRLKTVTRNINEQTLKQQTEKMLRTWKMQPERFLRKFDLDKNGKIAGKEWQVIREHAERKVLEMHQTQAENVISKPEEPNQPFIVSAIPEETLLKQKRISLAIYFSLFFLFLYVWLLMIKLH